MEGKYKFRIIDMVFVVAVARRIKGSKPKTLKAAAARCAPQMVREQQPLANQLKRRDDIGKWLDTMVDHYAYIHEKGLKDEQENGE